MRFGKGSLASNRFANTTKSLTNLEKKVPGSKDIILNI